MRARSPHHQAESSLPSILRRFSRLQRSQVQTWRPFSTPNAQVRRAADSSSGIRPHVAQTVSAAPWFIAPVSTPSPAPHGIFRGMATPLIEPRTSRLVLRQWCERDRAPFAKLNAGPLVMEYFPAVLNRDQSNAMVDRLVNQLQRDGYGLWAVEIRTSGEFIGYVGLAVPGWRAAFTPCTEIGWRLARSAWGHGYATEAANEALATAFGPAGLHDVVSFTTTSNLRSQHVMQRVGMTRDSSEDFDHPLLTDGPLRRHVLYRLKRADWEGRGPMPTSRAPSLGLAGGCQYRH